jgi:hypothetical protein
MDADLLSHLGSKFLEFMRLCRPTLLAHIVLCSGEQIL